MKNLLLVLILSAPFFSIGQPTMAGGFGIAGKKVNGLLNVGYDIGNFSPTLDIRSAIGQNKAFFGLQAGYSIKAGQILLFRPYGGYWLRQTGKSESQDRYVHNGQTQVLSRTPEPDTNGHNWGGGLRVIYGPWFVDGGHLSQWNFNAGLTFKFL